MCSNISKCTVSVWDNWTWACGGPIDSLISSEHYKKIYWRVLLRQIASSLYLWNSTIVRVRWRANINPQLTPVILATVGSNVEHWKLQLHHSRMVLITNMIFLRTHCYWCTCAETRASKHMEKGSINWTWILQKRQNTASYRVSIFHFSEWIQSTWSSQALSDGTAQKIMEKEWLVGMYCAHKSQQLAYFRS